MLEDCPELGKSISRKVQKTGGVSLSITLPKLWVQKAGVEPGADLKLSIDDHGDLVIHSPNKESLVNKAFIKEKLIMASDDDEELLVRNIVAAYLHGNNVIKIHSKQSLTAKKIRHIGNLINNFIGLELIDSNIHEISIHDLSSPESVDIIRFIKRMNQTVLRMLDDTIQGFSQNNSESLHSVILEEPNIDKLYYLLSRQLRSFLTDLKVEEKFNFTLATVIDFERIIKRLEGLADHCFKVSQIGLHLINTSDEKLYIENEILDDAILLIDMFREVMMSFFTRNVTKSNQLINDSHTFRDKVWNRIVGFNIEKSSLTVFNLLRLLERINNYVADIGEATINIYS